MKLLRFIFLFVFSVLLSGCDFSEDGFWTGDSNVNNRYSGFKNLSGTAGDSFSTGLSAVNGEYEILVLTDVHVGARFFKNSTVQAFYNWLDAYDKSKIKFCLSLGDFADDGTESQMQDYAGIVNRIESVIGNANGSTVKVFNVLGNHDLYNDEGWESWKKYCYPHTSYYKFETGAFAWYALDTGSGSLGSKQFASFKDEITKEGKIPVIFTHYPLVNESYDITSMPFAMRDTTERNILMKYLSDNRTSSYFCGHYHRGNVNRYGSFVQFNLKSFGDCGKWYIVKVNENSRTFDVREFSD